MGFSSPGCWRHSSLDVISSARAARVVCGIDVLNDMIDVTRKHLPGERLARRVHSQVADASHVRFCSRQFDAPFLRDTLAWAGQT